MLIRFFIFLLLTFSGFLGAQNPFAIDVPIHRELTIEDYLSIQQKLKAIDISELLHQRFDRLGKGYTTFQDFKRRCMVGANQVLIDLEKNCFPTRVFRKLGQGGDENCLVCFTSYNKKYPEHVRALEKGLEDVGYNGYLLYYIGGWPNPTGEEIKYVGVPYSFKIFVMQEAYLLGCRNVLWIDSACYPLRDINPLFDHIKEKGALLFSAKMPRNQWRYLFPETHTEILELTGTNVLDPDLWYIAMGLFGLRMDSNEAQEFVSEFYRLVELGTPFLSCFPEEWVITAIMARFNANQLSKQKLAKLLMGSPTGEEDSLKEFEKVRRLGFYFYHRKGLP